ncbi:hypothetical protein CH354_11265 [Leptospira levettii]|nr:hypothetical protein CH354_11265 [Leptospira levettii]PJZ87279.1 hypothetical protein CH368_17665 [Leptospira levettii]PKA00309.1 hypothetical protein CH369_07350 [Leptospira levettii]
MDLGQIFKMRSSGKKGPKSRHLFIIIGVRVSDSLESNAFLPEIIPKIPVSNFLNLVHLEKM